jgi:hypothetical protein
MAGTIKLRSTSLVSAQGDDIILRETEKTRLLFRPQVVDNPHDAAASVKGWFIFQAKKPSGLWADYKTLDLSKLRDGEWIKLEIRSAELKRLFTELDRYYEIHKQYGIRSGEHEYIVTPKNAAEIIKSFLRNSANVAKLQELGLDDLRKLSVAANLNSLRTVITTWEQERHNESEEFWQSFLQEHSWIIGQVFASPVVLLKGKAYVGGKTIENRGGNLADFLFKNHLTENVLIVELKTPVSPLLSATEYRQGTYRFSDDLGGGISQILKYKHELQASYRSFQSEGPQFSAFDPKCLIVSGDYSREIRGDSSKRRSFSLLRDDSRNVAIVTYDELLGKVKLLIQLLEQ